jgi:UDP-GlcNAc:undecaprenyl-phosphate GlcNAc-1-phosphate transferase
MAYLVPVVCVLVPLVISWLLSAGLIGWAPRLGLVDIPNERKVHTTPTPRGGGLAIYAGLLVATLIAFAAGWLPIDHLILVGIALILVVVGVLDDRFGLSWKLRLGLQTVAVLLAFGWPLESGWLPWPLALIWAVGLVNAFNMLDNMDALSAGVAAITALVMAVALIARADCNDGLPASVLPYLMLPGAIAGFLWFNRPPARIFMGDAGSTFLGFFLALHGLRDGFAVRDDLTTWLAPLCFFAVPWYDLTSVVLLRLSQGRSPFQADRQHLSHRLVELGLAPPAAVGAIYFLALASAVGGVLLYAVSGVSATLVGMHVFAWWLAIAWIDFFARRKSK